MDYACKVYRANFPNTQVICGNIQNIKSFPSVDLLAGCYPCQGFSQGGARKSNRKINYLYREFARVLKIVKPKAFVVENVSGMLRKNYTHLLKNQVTFFRLCGYKVAKPKILNACDYGVPQNRKRIFIVGIRSDFNVEYKFPVATHGTGKAQYVTQKDVLSKMPSWPEGEFYDKEFHWYYMSRNRRRDWNEPSATIVASQRHLPLHPISPKLVKVDKDKWVFESEGPARRFSYKEAAILQGFPHNFKFPDSSLAKKYEVIGNAVPPPLFKSVVRAIPDIW